MAVSDVEKLIVSLEARTKEYERALARAQSKTVSELRKMEKQAESFATRFDRKLGAVGSSLKSFGAGFLGGLGIEQLARAAAIAVKSIADIGDQAKKLGLTNAEFQELSAVAKYSGSDVEALAKGMKTLGINSSEAARGQGQFADILAANGIKITNANGQLKTQAEILGIVADLVQNAASEQDGLAIAQAALGKSGADLMLILQDGAEGVRKAMQTASEESVRFTDLQIRKAQEFDDNIDILVDNISVSLKGAFIDAVIGAESYAMRAGAALETMGVNTKSFLDGVAAAAANAVKYNPMFLSTTMALGALQGEGVSGNSGQIPITRSAPGKTSLPGNYTSMGGAGAGGDAQNEVLRNREELIRNISRYLDEVAQKEEDARKKAEADKAFAWASAYEMAYDRVDEANKQFLEGQEQLHDSMQQLGEIGVNALDRIVVGGEKASDVFKDLARQLASAALQSAFLGQGPLASFGGTSGGGGLLGGIFGKLLGGGAAASIYHAGGIAGGGGMSRRVHPATFAGAARYHSGGIAGVRSGEVPAILQKGERIIPRGGSAMQAPKIIINNNAGVDVQPSRGRDGTFRFDINKAISDALASGGADGAMGARFGARPTRTRR